MKLTESKNVCLYVFQSMTLFTNEFCRQDPESKYLELKRPLYDSFLYLARHNAVNFHSLK